MQKRACAKNAQNCFLNCLLPKEVASTIDSHIDEIEMEVLHASWTSEFSHSLDPSQYADLAFDGLAIGFVNHR